MSIILDPLLEANPDAYQVALIKKILDQIKMHDDGLTTTAPTNSDNFALQKQAFINRVEI